MRDFKTLFMALLLIVAGAWLLMLAGCSGEQLNGWPATAEFERLVNGSARFSKHDTGVAGLYIVVDHETGIEYAAYRNKAFTPLLDEEGRPLRVREAGE